MPSLAGRARTVRTFAAIALLFLTASGSSACVGRKANNDGPKRPGEPNPAQPYEDERQQLEQDSQRST